MSGNTTDPRAITARIATSYDLIPYNPAGVGSPGLDIPCLFGVACLFGDTPPRRNLAVLDLGCGSGGQIRRAAIATLGPIVGIDISGTACAEARARCAHIGERCVIRQADLLDLDPAALGTFDVIYMVGVYYAVPPAAQDRLIEILCRCLAPGGVVVMSYYAPDIWRSIDRLRHNIHGAIDMTAEPRARIEAARRYVADLARGGSGEISERILGHAMSCDEPTFFHEMLGEILAPVTAAELERKLAPAGIHFLSWMVPGPYIHAADPGERAAAADLMPGGYHYALFGRSPAAGQGAWRHVAWQTRLRRVGVTPFGLTVFTDPASGQGLEVASSATANLLDALAGGPKPWPELLARLAASPGGAAYTAAIKKDFLTLWLQGAVTPVWAE